MRAGGGVRLGTVKDYVGEFGVFFVLVVVVKVFWIRVKTFIVLRCGILLFALGS